MYKNEYMYIIEQKELSLENLMQAFYKGADIVFLTNEHIFQGGTTKGDIKRNFKRQKQNMSLNELINTHMRYIKYSNDKQAFAEAEKLFAENRRIENIPVIDQMGKLLFQIDRNHQQESNMNFLQDAIRNGSIKSFLESDDIEKILLAGAEYEFLLKVQKLLKAFCENTVLVEILEDIKEYCYADKKTKVICLNENAAFYINQNTKFQAAAISVKELASFVDFSYMEKLDENTIVTWKNIFKYEAVVFCSSNQFINQLGQMLKKSGIEVYDWKSYAAWSFDITSDFLSSLDVLLLSEGGVYCEKIQVTKMIKIMGLLLTYKQISGSDITVEQYMESCVSFLKYLHQEGFVGIQYEINSVWKEKLYNKIKLECDLEVVKDTENRSLPQNYIINTDACIGKAAAGDYICDLQENFLKYICEYAEYLQICKLCKNVYIFPVQEHVVMDSFKAYLERDRYNFIHNRDQFPDNFVRDICGEEEYPLDEVIRNLQDCQIVKINDGYTKFLSNYHTAYFNTDAYGRRVVPDVPSAFSRTIWLIGGCEFAGYAVEDKHTPASFLQKKINELGYSYKVVNLSHDSADSLTLYNKILDSNIESNDIIVVSEHVFIPKEKVVNIDYKEINKKLGGKTWYWNSVAHPGIDGYKIYAENIFNSIKADLIMKTRENNKFFVDKSLESKIHHFITELKDKLDVDEQYQTICNRTGIGFGKKGKRGAIVMNCNPFTYGHQYLVETASRLVDLLYIFVVEENKSVFPFKERFCMVQAGTKQLENVIVFPSGEFMISTVTFPGYFLKDIPTKECYDTFLDLKIFAHYIAPAFGISIRFVGEEPTDKVTMQYNLDMKEILGINGISVIEIPRKKYGEDVISASKVRRLLDTRDYALLEKYIPETTMSYVVNNTMKPASL